MAEFNIPSFLQNKSPDDLQQIGLTALPSDIDVSEGSHTWNFTRSTALIAGEICEYILPEVIKIIFPEYSYGEFLDEHAKGRGITRRSATAATGTVTITGESGTAIPNGSLFATSAVNDDESHEYKTTEYATIPSTGSVEVHIECTTAGIGGNTQAGTIIHVGSRLTGITSVTNEAATTGGTDEEDDESLIGRILEYDRSMDGSFVGSPADYKRWAESVAGVGIATVIPAQDNSGLVTIYILDSNGDPANEDLCDDVYNYIMSPDDESKRLAPTNATLSVVAPETVSIAIKATVELLDDATIDSVSDGFLALLEAYLPGAANDTEIRYSKITSILSQTNGVYDYTNVQICVVGGTYGTSNIALTSHSLPVILEENITLTAAT